MPLELTSNLVAVRHSAAFKATTFPTKSQVRTNAFCTWTEFTDGFVTLPCTVISSLLNYLEAILHKTDAFVNSKKLLALSRWSPKLTAQ